MRHVLVAVTVVPLAVVTIAVGGASVTGAVVVGVVGVALVGWAWHAVGRNYRSWGYVERGDDLVVTHGAMFKSLVVVPYGRMQLVDVKAGPIERSFGLVRVKLHTAAATTDAELCGLTFEEANGLRDRLTARGEAHAAGL